MGLPLDSAPADKLTWPPFGCGPGYARETGLGQIATRLARRSAAAQLTGL